MAARDPRARREIASLAASSRWAKTVDRTAATAAAREAFLASFEPGPEVTDPRQRASMTEQAFQAYMIQLRRKRQRIAEARRGLVLDATGLADCGSDGVDLDVA